MAWNPTTIEKNIDNILQSVYEADYVTVPAVAEPDAPYAPPEQLDERIKELTEQMKAAAANLDFEEAALLRDRIKALEARELALLEAA